MILSTIVEEFYLVKFLAPLVNYPIILERSIQSLRTLNLKILPLFQILQAEEDGATIPKEEEEQEKEQENSSMYSGQDKAWN